MMSKRNVPTRPGWWWVQYDGGRPQCMMVHAVHGEQVEIADVSISAFVPGGMLRWLAPVPSPAVCEALARASKRLAAYPNAADRVAQAADALGWTDAADYMRGADEFKAALEAWREVSG